MKILINGQARELDGNNTLNQIIQQFCKDNKHVIAELNGEIVKSPKWQETTINDGDAVELVSIVGGG